VLPNHFLIETNNKNLRIQTPRLFISEVVAVFGFLKITGTFEATGKTQFKRKEELF
jgi:hypothetical protein